VDEYRIKLQRRGHFVIPFAGQIELITYERPCERESTTALPYAARINDVEFLASD